jgi:hypothetical protein
LVPPLARFVLRSKPVKLDGSVVYPSDVMIACWAGTDSALNSVTIIFSTAADER